MDGIVAAGCWQTGGPDWLFALTIGLLGGLLIAVVLVLTPATARSRGATSGRRRSLRLLDTAFTVCVFVFGAWQVWQAGNDGGSVAMFALILVPAALARTAAPVGAAPHRWQLPRELVTRSLVVVAVAYGAGAAATIVLQGVLGHAC